MGQSILTSETRVSPCQIKLDIFKQRNTFTNEEQSLGPMKLEGEFYTILLLVGERHGRRMVSKIMPLSLLSVITDDTMYNGSTIYHKNSK